MKARVLVSLKDEVLDPGGRALAERIRSIGFTEVKDAKLGKYIELYIETGDREKEKERIEEMCLKLLANPLIEDYEVLPDTESGQGKQLEVMKK